MAIKSKISIGNTIKARWIKSVLLVITVIMFVFCHFAYSFLNYIIQV